MLATVSPSDVNHDQFFAHLCHEIRTPLNAILGLSRLLANGQCRPDQYGECTAMLNQSASLLAELLNDVLDFSKLDAGQMTLEEVPFDLEQIIHSTLQIMRPQAIEKGLALHAHCPHLPPLKGDPLRLKQVLLNLVSNAIKFTDEGFISLYVQATPDMYGDQQLRITVTDTGVGIPESRQQAVFQRFTQAETSTARHHGGSGLGLSICKLLVEAMDGTINVTSEPNAGSQFTVLLNLPTVTPITLAA